MKHKSYGFVQTGLQECLYSGSCGLSWHLASYFTKFFSSEHSENIEKESDEPEEKN